MLVRRSILDWGTLNENRCVFHCTRQPQEWASTMPTVQTLEVDRNRTIYSCTTTAIYIILCFTRNKYLWIENENRRVSIPLPYYDQHVKILWKRHSANQKYRTSISILSNFKIIFFLSPKGTLKNEVQRASGQIELRVFYGSNCAKCRNVIMISSFLLWRPAAKTAVQVGK